MRWIEHTIEVRLGLQLNREKTKVLNVGEKGVRLEFLGFELGWSRSHRRGGGPPYVRVQASKRARQRARDRVRDLTGPRFCFLPPKDVVQNLNRFLRGWLQYYSLGHPSKVRWDLIRFTEDRVVRHLRRRSQRPYRPPKGISLHQHVGDLGLLDVMGKARG